MPKLVLALGSPTLDKLTSAGVIMTGAAADDMEIEVFILVNAGHAFKKNAVINQMSDNTQTADEFNAELKRLNSSNWIELFEMSKELTDVTVHVCSLAGKIANAEQMEDFIDLVDDICGIGEYTTSSQEADVNLFI